MILESVLFDQDIHGPGAAQTRHVSSTHATSYETRGTKQPTRVSYDKDQALIRIEHIRWDAKANKWLATGEPKSLIFVPLTRVCEMRVQKGEEPAAKAAAA